MAGLKPKVSGMRADGVGKWHDTTTNKRGHRHVKTRVRRGIKRRIRREWEP